MVGLKKKYYYEIRIFFAPLKTGQPTPKLIQNQLFVYNNSPCLIFSTDGDWDEREDDFSDLEEIE